MTWSEDVCQFKNRDGLVGGGGKFDGENSFLFKYQPTSENTVQISSEWKGDNYYSPGISGNSASIFIDLITQHGLASTNVLNIRQRDEQQTYRYPLSFIIADSTNNPDLSPIAMQLRAVTGSHNNGSLAYCQANPIWGIPYEVTIDVRGNQCPIAPGKLHAKFKFGSGMSVTRGSVDVPSAHVNHIDLNGFSTGKKYILDYDPTNSNYSSSTLSFRNGTQIPCDHLSSGKASYAITVSGLKDANANPMHAIADTFSTVTVGSLVPSDGSTSESINGNKPIKQ